MQLDRSYAEHLDASDPLAHFRNEFVVADPRVIYLDGNSLGRLPRRTAGYMQAVVEKQWGERLIRGWGEGWFTAPQRIGAKIAQLIGAKSDEVIVTDSTSVDLFKLLLAGLQARPGRHTIVTDDMNFPSDLYLMQGAAQLAGRDFQVVTVVSQDGLTIGLDQLQQVIDGDTALVCLTHTAFKSGYVYDMKAVTDLAHQRGALIIWDLSHSAGAIPVDLAGTGADMAVGCTYKYLNGGPGAPAYLYVRKDLQVSLISPIWGWFGQKGQFEMGLNYTPAPGMTRFMAGTPTLLSLAAVEPGVELLLEAGVDRLRAKSVQQTEYMIALWETLLKPYGVTLNSPRNADQRGSHVSLGHPDGLRVDRALIDDMQVIPDFRYPDNIRLGIAPIYTSFVDIFEAMERFKTVMADRLYAKYPTERPDVT